MVRFFKHADKSRRGSAKSNAIHKPLEIVGFSSEGRGIAKQQGRTVFVDGGLPGELCTVKKYTARKSYDECAVADVLRPSKFRLEPSCRHFSQCGGCQLQHLDWREQVDLKSQDMLSLFRRKYQLQSKEHSEPIAVLPFEYRSRVRLRVDKKGRLALVEKASQRLVPITECPILAEELQSLLPSLQTFVSQCYKDPAIPYCFGHIDLIEALPKTQWVIRVLQEDSCSPERIQQVCQSIAEKLPSELFALVKCWLQFENKGRLIPVPLLTSNDEVSSEVADEGCYYNLQNGHCRLYFAPNGFTQNNRKVNDALVTQVLSWLAPSSSDRLLDLFCGNGNFTIPVASRAHSVVGIECQPQSLALGQRNAEVNQLSNIEFVCADLFSEADIDSINLTEYDKILLDPPRSGAELICHRLAKHRFKCLVYVSCNPSSFARDAKILVDAGYQLQHLQAVDMFPQTAHLESVALFVPSN